MREVEFSPSDLRTLKGSTDTLTRTIQQPPGMGKEGLVMGKSQSAHSSEIVLGLAVSSLFLLL